MNKHTFEEGSLRELSIISEQQKSCGGFSTAFFVQTGNYRLSPSTSENGVPVCCRVRRAMA